MRRLSAKMRQRRSGGDRHPFAFFIIAALILLAAVFVIGIQAGRLVERRAQGSAQGNAPARGVRSPGSRTAPASPDVGRKLDAFAEEAAKVPGAKPRSADEELAATEKSLTFRRTLVEKDPRTVPLKPAASPSRARAAGAAPNPPGKTYIVQAGAFAERGTAEALKDKLAGMGISSASVAKGSGPGGKTLYRVVVGPFLDRAQARKTILRLQADAKTKAILVSG